MYSQILYILNYTLKFLSIREYHNVYCGDVTDTAKYLKFTTELLLSRETNIYLTFKHVLNRLFPLDNLGFITPDCKKTNTAGAPPSTANCRQYSTIRNRKRRSIGTHPAPVDCIIAIDCHWTRANLNSLFLFSVAMYSILSRILKVV